MTSPAVSPAALTRPGGESRRRRPALSDPGAVTRLAVTRPALAPDGGGPGLRRTRPGTGSPFAPDPQELFSWPDPRAARSFAAGAGEPGWLTGKAAAAYSCDAKITPMVCGHLDRNARPAPSPPCSPATSPTS